MIFEVLYIVFCLILAFVNSKIIKADKPIYHGINGALHIACWCLVAWKTSSWFPVVIMPFIGRLFFDVALNLMRGKALDYVSLKPRAVADKVEKSIFGMNAKLPKVIYLVVIVVVNLIGMFMRIRGTFPPYLN